MAGVKREAVLSDRTLRRQATARAEQCMSNAHSIDVEDQECPSIPNNLTIIDSGLNSNIVADAAVSDIIDNSQNIDNHMDDDDSLLSDNNHSDLDDFQESEPEQQHCGVMSDNEQDDSGDETDDDDNEEIALTNALRKWVLESGIPLTHANSLLGILRTHFPFLPKDSRTLLHTLRTYEIDEIAGGQYHHFGVEAGIKSRLMRHKELCSLDEILLQVNMDGLPLFKSSKESFWPILGLIPIEEKPEPFVMGLWVGGSKPTNANEYLQKFVDEMNNLENDGITYNDKTYQVKISCFICDTPARAFVKRTKGHTGYYGCDYCEQRGVHINHRMTFPEMNASPRTDVQFDEMEYEEHQHGESILSQLNVGMVSQFPLDYMHLVCLGVVKKLILLWTNGPLDTRLGNALTKRISSRLIQLKLHLPREFLRKGRPIAEVDRWKATEFRTFLLYTGPVALKGKLHDVLYDNFMLLFVGITILCSPTLWADYCNYAGLILIQFVDHVGNAYGAQQIIYNIHCITHISSHSRQFGPLHTFSSFPFENYLQTLKKLVRKPQLPLPQAIRRLTEKMHTVKPVHVNTTYCKKKAQQRTLT